MKKISRVLAILASAIFAFAAIVLLGVNMYVQSQQTQKRIQQELSQRLGTPLNIRRMSVTPWSGLKLSGITIPQTDSKVAGHFLEAKTFALRVRLASLFSKRLVIKQISLVNPVVVWTQNNNGKWRLPLIPGEGKQNTPATAAIAPNELSVTAPQPNESSPKAVTQQVEHPPTEIPTATPTEKSFTPEVRWVYLSGGHFRFLDGKMRVVALFDEVKFRSDFRSAKAVRGNISIGKTSLRDRFFLEQLQSPLEYGPTQLDFSHVTARAAGGEISGRFTMHPEEADSPFQVAIEFRGLQADQLLSNAGGTAGTLIGRLEGRFDAQGNTPDPNALNGKGEIFLHDGEVKQYSLLTALGQLTQIEELQQLHLDQAQVKFHIEPGVVTVDELLLRSPNIRLSAIGKISFEGKLSLESQLAVNEKVRAQLFRAIRDSFQPIDEAGYAAVNFQIGGTIDRPKTNLMEKLVGRDLGGVIDRLLGRKKAKPAPTPNELPNPSPSP